MNPAEPTLTIPLLSLLNVLLVPIVGLLWRISTQIAALAATQQAHDGRLEALEALATRSRP